MNREFNLRVEAKMSSGFIQDILCIPVDLPRVSLHCHAGQRYSRGFSRRLPDAEEFRALHKILCETGMLYDTGYLISVF